MVAGKIDVVLRVWANGRPREDSFNSNGGGPHRVDETFRVVLDLEEEMMSEGATPPTGGFITNLNVESLKHKSYHEALVVSPLGLVLVQSMVNKPHTT